MLADWFLFILKLRENNRKMGPGFRRDERGLAPNLI